MIMPRSQVKKFAPRFVLISARFFSMTSVNPSTPPDFSIRYMSAPMSRKEMSVIVFPLLSKV